MLFAELALIRWVSAYQVHVAYFTNFVLLASFLGIGVGFLRSGRERNGFRWAPASFAIFAALVFVVRVVKGFGDAPGLESSFGLPAPPIWIVLPVLFLGAVWVMANVAEGVARLFERFEPLEAYRLDITGSLLGIVVFSALSFLGLGPIVWGVLLGDRVPRVDACRGLRGPLGRGGGGRGRAGARVPRATRRLVAVLPGHGLRRRRRRTDPGPRELAPAPGDAPARRDPRRVLREAVHASGRAPGRRADRRRGERQRRRAGARRGRGPRRRRRDRPPSAASRERAASRAPVPGPACDAAHRRRTRLPRTHRRDVRPDPVRAARLADARERPGIAPARELPVHARGDGGGARPPRAGRGVRDVQLLPPRRVRALREHDARGVRPRAVLRRGPARGGGARAIGADDRTGGRRHHRARRSGRPGRTRRPPPPTTTRSRT